VPGVRLAGVHAGIKPRKRDLALIAFDGSLAQRPVVVAIGFASIIATSSVQLAAPRLAWLVDEHHGVRAVQWPAEADT